MANDAERPAEKIRRPRRIVPAEEIAAALRECYGNKAAAARRLGITRQTIWNRARREPTIARAIEEGTELLKDAAEWNLARAVLNGEPWAIQFYLSRRARDRGYGDQLTVAGDLPTVVRVKLVWDDVPQPTDAPEGSDG